MSVSTEEEERVLEKDSKLNHIHPPASTIMMKRHQSKKSDRVRAKLYHLPQEVS